MIAPTTATVAERRSAENRYGSEEGTRSFHSTVQRLAATASVVGAIIGELPSGLQDGLGGAIINFNQYYSIEPQELWATNVIAALLGIAFFVIVVAAERIVVRRAPENVA